jgi:hypothetical protein
VCRYFETLSFSSSKLWPREVHRLAEQYLGFLFFDYSNTDKIKFEPLECCSLFVNPVPHTYCKRFTNTDDEQVTVKYVKDEKVLVVTPFK